jgi:hypothetical protein
MKSRLSKALAAKPTTSSNAELVNETVRVDKTLFSQLGVKPFEEVILRRRKVDSIMV